VYCCPNCFNHDFIKDYIKVNREKSGKCSICFSSKVPLINPKSLSDYFQPIIDLYQVSSSGKSLVNRMQEDWLVFENSLTDTKKTQLLSVITGDVVSKKSLFESRYSHGSAFLSSWEEFKKELQHENRFFPKKAIDTEQIKELIDYLILDTSKNPRFIYRSRINREKREYLIDEMGKPPDEKAPDGRANPKGISYFYGASDEKTSIAETRPYKSEIISVGKFQLKNDVKLIDLRRPILSISPFEMDDDNLILLHKDHMPFLKHLSQSLSIPVLPYKKELEYLPTQYLCELIKDKGFDGIVFKSSLGLGDNYVIFDDTILSGKKIEYYRADEIVFKPVKVKL
jgi:hypothetical protein